jgi:hypothetical protein
MYIIAIQPLIRLNVVEHPLLLPMPTTIILVLYWNPIRT